jgi:predicted Zn-ribbon and HTH transcriptional regulator
MPNVLCFTCGGSFKVDFNVKEPTKKCPKCLSKPTNKMVDIGFDKDDFWKTQETFE